MKKICILINANCKTMSEVVEKAINPLTHAFPIRDYPNKINKIQTSKNNYSKFDSFNFYNKCFREY